ncbi:MAG: DegT/DnrJ/EryC1/StrS family aminotransferase [Pseudomonas sp.]
MKKNTTVTSPLLPPLEDFLPYLEQIWASGRLTNGGPFHVQLEEQLCEYLGVEHISLFANGTLALLTALQALKIEGEVITTPYSFVATSHALLWNRLTPVFVDIDPLTCNLDPTRIEAAITPRTQAILPVHCYGIPCDVEAIQEVADRHGLKVIYDAAHAFGVEHNGRSILRAGDLSILSFHATKVFNTFEGGAIVSPDLQTKQDIDYLKNFGFSDEVTVVAPGINGKMNEVQAAMGLVQLRYIEGAIAARRRIFERYRTRFSLVDAFSTLTVPAAVDWNYSYFPIFFKTENSGSSRDYVYEGLRKEGVLARRYFYPLISEFPMYKDCTAVNLSIATEKSAAVLCLPIYPSLDMAEQDRIIDITNELCADMVGVGYA